MFIILVMDVLDSTRTVKTSLIFAYMNVTLDQNAIGPFLPRHGKSPCDGLGGTLKRLAARASLQRPLSNQILTPQQFFEFCRAEVTGINVSFISSESMNVVRRNLEERFKLTNTLPGTRSFHQFVILSERVMAVKRVSEDQTYPIEFDLVSGRKSQGASQPKQDPRVSDFVVCTYDEKHWIGIVDEVDHEHDDIKVKFMHPSYPARSYTWPKNEDTCFVPNIHVICIIGAPVTATGRQYTLTEEDIDKIEQNLVVFI